MLDDAPADVQPEAAALRLAGERVARLAELVEDDLLVLGADSLAIVTHIDAHELALLGKADLDAAADPAAKLAEIDARLQKLRSPFRSAETFWIEEMIDPRDTRRLLCEFAELAAPLRTAGPFAHPMRP